MSSLKGDKVILQCLITEDLIKEEFPAMSNFTWFNTGILGIMPKSAVKVIAEAMLQYETELFFKYSEVEESVVRLRARLASLISAGAATDICFTRNANEGIIIGLSAIDFEPSDEIVISNQEHGALLDRVNYIQQRGRAKLRAFEISKEADETLQAVRCQVTDNTKLLAFSHVSCQTGIRLPVKEICEVAREVDAYVLIDGAQSVGNVPVKVRDYNCDFYVGNGHKWLCGPRGTSFLYVNPNSVLEFSPSFLAFAFFDGSKTSPNALKFEYGTRDKMLLFGFLAVLDLYAKWNWQQHSGRIEELSAHLKDGLNTIPRCTVHTPMNWANSSGNTAFSMAGYSLGRVGEYLSKEWSIMTRPVPELNAVRVSTNYFNTLGEIDKLIKALDAL